MVSTQHQVEHLRYLMSNSRYARECIFESGPPEDAVPRPPYRGRPSRSAHNCSHVPTAQEGSSTPHLDQPLHYLDSLLCFILLAVSKIYLLHANTLT